MQENRPSRPERRGERKERRVSSKKLAPITEVNESEKEQASAGVSGSEEAVTSPEQARETPVVRPPRRVGRRPGDALRASVAVVGGRTAGALSRRLRLGGGTSIAGIVAQRLYPDIIEHLSTQLKQGSILVTGTNGKTTTSGFIAAILSDAGLRVWRNREGSNLLRGIAGALVIRTLPNGKLRRSGQAISIFEVDEAVMPQAVQTIPTRVAVFTNLFRDQLDRYGEVDSVLEHWKRAISALPPETILVLNADDPTIADLGRHFAGRVVYFGIEDHGLDLMRQETSAERHQVMDTRVCSKCGSEYIYDLRFYSHIGHYRCPSCGQERPSVTVAARKVENESFDRQRIEVQLPGQEGEIIVPLPGLYNVYNALAAIAAAQALELSWEPTVSGIEQFKPAFGRGERIQVAGRTIRMLLAKNPTGFNEVLRTLFASGESASSETPAKASSKTQKHHVLFVLNDNIADGKDISWIWDVDFELALQGFTTLTIAGTRARDLALRLKYAGFDMSDVALVPSAPLRAGRKDERAASSKRRARANRRGARRGMAEPLELPPVELETTGSLSLAVQSPLSGNAYGIAQALDQAIKRTPEGETLFIVPTYTGLLEIHRELERRGLTPHYWEETGP
ncbi:MAG TPA: MurT ligase domain-containing protein [Ktedonobacteraceae bacterium]|nr:MurT ligase domain-containing protein [Ktedonobacteraceae bacterium]